MFIDKIIKLGFNQHKEDFYIHPNCSILVTKWANSYIITLYGSNGMTTYEILLKINDFHSSKITEHDLMLNHIMSISVFNRRKKIEKIIEKIR